MEECYPVHLTLAHPMSNIRSSRTRGMINSSFIAVSHSCSQFHIKLTTQMQQHTHVGNCLFCRTSDQLGGSEPMFYSFSMFF